MFTLIFITNIYVIFMYYKKIVTIKISFLFLTKNNKKKNYKKNFFFQTNIKIQNLDFFLLEKKNNNTVKYVKI